eukprot:scpid98902/ scgid18267/ 
MIALIMEQMQCIGWKCCLISLQTLSMILLISRQVLEMLVSRQMVHGNIDPQEDAGNVDLKAGHGSIVQAVPIIVLQILNVLFYTSWFIPFTSTFQMTMKVPVCPGTTGGVPMADHSFESYPVCCARF